VGSGQWLRSLFLVLFKSFPTPYSLFPTPQLNRQSYLSFSLCQLEDIKADGQPLSKLMQQLFIAAYPTNARVAPFG